MHIVHLGKYYHPAKGGVETHVRTLAQGQAALGHRVTVVGINHLDSSGNDVTHQHLGRTTSIVEQDGQVEVIRVGRIGNLARFDITTNLLKTLKQIQRTAVDVWHLHTPNVSMILALFQRQLSGPLVITHHSDVIKQKSLYRFLAPFENRVYRDAPLLLSDSPGYIDGSQMLQRYRDRVDVLPLGIDLQPYQCPNPAATTAAAEFRERYTGPRWLFVGRLIYYKGLHVAIKALKSVPGELLIVGVGPLEQALRQQTQSEGVADRCHFLGNLSQDQLVGAYHAATSLWFPSMARSEGFGQVQVEAMACGCPVINTFIPHSGVDWVSVNGLSGLTIPVEDSAALVAASMRILNEPGLSEQLAAGGRTRAVAEFSDQKMSQRSIELYARLLADRAAGNDLNTADVRSR